MILADLSALRGVSGDEHAVAERITALLEVSVDAIETDVLGNLLVYKGLDRPGRRLMVAAHMDEIGLMITGYHEQGFLHFAAVGAIDARLLPAASLEIGPTGLPGVIMRPPMHLMSVDERQRVPEPDELLIDIGAVDRRSAEALVRIGDRAAFTTQFGSFGAGLYKGRALDDRVGCALLAGLLQSDLPGPLIGAFTVQEEIGLRGARTAAYTARPEVALVLEGTTCADIPLVEPAGQVTKLGGGPALTFMDGTTIPLPWMTRRIQETAARNGIPWQWRQTAGGGTDAGAIHLTREGIPTTTLSVPCRYIHGPCSVIDSHDLDHTARLLRAAVEDLTFAEFLGEAPR
ncbi:MAG: hypothetical protein WD535_01670 [Thermaerobacterales bacterium]